MKSEDKRLETMRNCALAHGFSYCHIACVPQCVGRGGTATLISDRVEVNNATSFDRCGGNMTVTNFELKKIKLRAVNVYAPQQELDPKGVPLETRRDHYYNKLKKHVTKSTILGGDFQNVLDVSLDLRRTANSAYENGGAEILRTIISENELEDEIRNGLGLGFDFTRCETVTSRGVTNTCQSRIDRIYHCIHQNLQWTSEILPIGEVCESDHAMVTLKMEIIEDSPETDTKKELITLDAKLLKNADFHSEVAKLVQIAVTAERQPQSNINKIMSVLKHDLKKLWKSATKKKRASLNKDIEFVKAQLDSIHQAGKARSLTTTLIHQRKNLTERLASLKVALNPPKTVHALPVKKRGECMSREFWARAFPHGRGERKLANLTKLQTGVPPRRKIPKRRNPRRTLLMKPLNTLLT